MQVPPRASPNTFEYIEAVALREPQRLALVQQGRGWDYQSLYADVARVIRVLRDLGVRRGQRVAVGMSGLQANLVLLFAAESLGAVTFSFLHGNDTGAQDGFALVDWVFSDIDQQVGDGARFVFVGEAFLAKVAAVDAAQAREVPRVALALHEPQRISRTSGSTGRSRFMVHTRFAQEYWIEGVARTGKLAFDSRVLLVGPLVLNGHFARAAWCLRMGAAVFDVDAAALPGHDITHLCALPLKLDEFLRSLPAGYVAKRPVLVFTTGGAVPGSLRERALRAFGGPVTSRYGMNEVGSICDDMDERGIGVLSPGLDLRIVADDGSDVPSGEPGIICVRGPALTDGYLGDPDATRAAFRDGWFHSGDWGQLVAPRVLRLAGRHDDLVNVGGIKMPASKMEERIRRIVPAEDCAVLVTHLDGGATTLGIAIVARPGTVREDARRKIALELQTGVALGARVVFLGNIPRTDNGKVDRMALHALIASPPAGSV